MHAILQLSATNLPSNFEWLGTATSTIYKEGVMATKASEKRQEICTTIFHGMQLTVYALMSTTI